MDKKNLQISHKSIRQVTTIFLLILCLNAYAQDHYISTAENGLNVRSEDDIASAKVGKIPLGAMVEKIADTDKVLVVNDNGKQIKGKFVKIKYYNYSCVVSENNNASVIHGYVFDGYLKQLENTNLMTSSKITKAEYDALEKKAFKQIKKAKAIRQLDSVKSILKHRVTWTSESDAAQYMVSNTIKTIQLENGRKLVFNPDCVDFSFSEGQSGYYPEYDILVLEGGHGIDVSFSIKTGATELTIGNPEYIIPSPNNSYRLNGSFGVQECISYFFQKNENDKFVYHTGFYICMFKAFYWLDDESFIYTTGNYWADAQNETEEYFKGQIVE